MASKFRNEIFGNGVEGLQTQLEADANDADAMRKGAPRCGGPGSRWGQYKKLAASGDLNTAQQFGELTPAEITAPKTQYAARLTQTNRLSATAAREVYGKSAAEFTRAIKSLDKRIDRLPALIERGATRGTAAGATAGQP